MQLYNFLVFHFNSNGYKIVFMTVVRHMEPLQMLKYKCQFSVAPLVRNVTKFGKVRKNKKFKN